MKEQKTKILMASCRHKEGLFGDIILKNAIFYPEREAFVCGRQRVNYKQYNARVNKLIHALKDKGIKKGEVLGVLSWSCIVYMDVFGAAEKAGFIIAPINVRLSVDEIGYVINDSEACTLFVGPELVEMVETLKSRLTKVTHFFAFEGPAPGMECYTDLLSRYSDDEPDTEVDDEDPLFICYTSGTTGRPRGALYTQGTFREAVIGHTIDVPVGEGGKLLGLMPPFHIGGIINLAYVFYQAATNIIMKDFDPEALLMTIQTERATDIVVVPTHLAMMIDSPDFKKYDLSSIKRIRYAGSPMPTALLKRGMEIFGPVFCQSYGQTESGPDTTFLKERDHEVLDKGPEEQKRLLSCGKPAFGVHVRIVDPNRDDVPPGQVGEIIVKSRHLMHEYWKKPEETRETIVDGWLHTGDMGRYDEAGYIYIMDRKKEMIISGGENIYPREVEEVLHTHPAVLECAVIGIPDKKWVEAVHAVVTLKQNAKATPEELINYCKNNMARYKAPKSLDIEKELPKNATGKILKKVIKEGKQEHGF
jgi:acyl-CoA synthetase (AMP-forming)/AMP-acid ligase II